MKTNSQKPNPKLWLAASGFALVLLTICPQRAEAQSNTFPSSGNVGVGTTSPAVKLQVLNGDISLGSDDGSGYPTINNGKYIRFKNYFLSGVGGARDVAALFSGFETSGSASSGYLSFLTDSSDVLVERMRISSSGNVGIGTITPGEKLEVSGNLKVTGTGNIDASGTITAFNIKAKYQDVAEWVESSQALPAGTVVVLDSTKSNQVTSSTRSYDTRVAGVISAQPGIALGESGDNKVLVATTGRVRVKVDASRGPIQIGDLLVTSNVPGVAMKSQPINLGGVQLHRPGTLVGKALEPLPKGMGEILVLLSLQ
jgi:hypothetical protein